MRSWLFGLLVLVGAWPLAIGAATGPDLAIVAGYVEFVPREIVAGQTARLYARVKNTGDIDATAQVLFYVGGTLIGASQPVSVLADGGFDDVFVDVLVPDEPFNVSVRVGGAVPAEVDLQNNEVLTPFFKPLPDDDRDTVIDTNDNCQGVPNTDQADQDTDNLGDACDEVDNRVPVSPPVVEPVIPLQPVESVSVVPSVPEQIMPLIAEVLKSEPTTMPVPETEAEVVVLTAERSLFGGGSTISPLASFTYSRTDWRTVDFKLLKKSTASEPAALAWDFGDGTTSAREEVTHTFSAAGVYQVTLAITDEYGNVSTDTELLKISFFHLDNPIIVLVLVVLLGLLVFLGMYVWRVKRILRAQV